MTECILVSRESATRRMGTTALIAGLMMLGASQTATASTLFNGGYTAPNWSADLQDFSGLGFNSVSITPLGTKAMKFEYSYGYYFGPGIYDGAQAVYHNVSDTTQLLDFNANYNSYQAYYQQNSAVYMFADTPTGVVTTYMGGFAFDADFQQQVYAGMDWGFIAYGANGDYDSRIFSTLVISNNGAVPEPASWAMMITGFGLTGAAMRSRRKGAVVA